MAHVVLVNGLIRKYAELLGELLTSEREIEGVTGLRNIQEATERIDRKKAELEIDLDHIAHVILIFDPAWNRKRVAPRMPRQAAVMGYKKAIRAAIAVIKEAERPLTSREIAGRMFTTATRPPESEMNKIDISVRAAMKRHTAKGHVQFHAGPPMRWSLAPAA